MSKLPPKLPKGWASRPETNTLMRPQKCNPTSVQPKMSGGKAPDGSLPQRKMGPQS